MKPWWKITVTLSKKKTPLKWLAKSVIQEKILIITYRQCDRNVDLPRILMKDSFFSNKTKQKQHNIQTIIEIAIVIVKWRGVAHPSWILVVAWSGEMRTYKVSRVLAKLLTVRRIRPSFLSLFRFCRRTISHRSCRIILFKPKCRIWIKLLLLQNMLTKYPPCTTSNNRPTPFSFLKNL